jgi:phytoene synthase
MDYVEAFLASMRMDLTVTEYATYDDLMVYVYGSAAVIGLEMVPVLEPLVPREVADPYASDLGIAFQLSNFIRDVGEDLQRGRVYLPMEDLAASASPRAPRARRRRRPVRRLLAFEVARTREVYRCARTACGCCTRPAGPCIETALRLYGGILDEVEAADYAVLGQRVSVGPATRARWPCRARASLGRPPVAGEGRAAKQQEPPWRSRVPSSPPPPRSPCAPAPRSRSRRRRQHRRPPPPPARRRAARPARARRAVVRGADVRRHLARRRRAAGRDAARTAG